MTDKPDWDAAREMCDRALYYNPNGEPISFPDWSALMWERNQETERLGHIPRESWWGRKTVVGKLEISTVWLGLDHNHWLSGPPLIWETMIFGDERHSEEQWRYATRAEAYDHHEELVRALRAGRDPRD